MPLLINCIGLILLDELFNTGTRMNRTTHSPPFRDAKEPRTRLRSRMELEEERIMALPSTGIQVRYSNARKPKLLSYAVYRSGNCEVSHETTENLRKNYGNDLGSLVAIEQKNNPNLPIIHL